jgi:hypothetical protein
MKSLARLVFFLPILTLTNAQDERIGLPPSIRLASTSVSGSGCKDGSFSTAELTEQNKLFVSSIYMKSRKGTGVSPDEALKACYVDFKFRYNRGEQFAVYAKEINGTVTLKKGMSGTQQTTVEYLSQRANSAVVRIMVHWSTL